MGYPIKFDLYRVFFLRLIFFPQKGAKFRQKADAETSLFSAKINVGKLGM